jgi:two-component system OmpR family response regulator
VNDEKTLVIGNIMIVEDEKDLCFLLSRALMKNNLQSQCVNSLNEANETIRDIKPSVVFLDNHLPDGYGSDFIPIIKALFPFAKVIMITAYDAPTDINLAFTRGADYFIGKPFDATSIKTTLDLLQLDFGKNSFSHLSS